MQVSAKEANVSSLAVDLLAQCKEVAYNIPHSIPARYQRVNLTLNADRAIAILAKKLENSPSVCDVVLWVEHAEPHMKASPNFLSRPSRQGPQSGLDPEFEAQLRRDFARARAQVHARHGEMMMPLLEQAQHVAAHIPRDAADRDNRLRIAVEAVARVQKQLDGCYLGEKEARRECY